MATPSYITSVEDNMSGRPGGNIPNPMVLEYTDEFAIDPTIRTPKDAGYVQTRARFTSIPRRYHIRYTAITTADKNLIYVFEKDTVVGGSEFFTWRLPTGGGNLTVRFVGPVRFWPWQNTNYKRWNVEFDVETISGV